MMRVLIMFAGVLALSLPAMAQEAREQAEIMKAKLTKGDQSPPTGYEVPGASRYVYDASRGYVRVWHPRSTAVPKIFWRIQESGEGNQGSGS